MKNFFFLHFFSINSSSRHEKRCQMLQRLFWLFQCSKNPRWVSNLNSGWKTSRIWLVDVLLLILWKHFFVLQRISLARALYAVLNDQKSEKAEFVVLLDDPLSAVDPSVSKVHIFWEDHQNFAKSPPIICPIYCQSNGWWRFCKILLPSKGQLISEYLFDFLNFQKKHRKIWQISALESKIVFKS